MTGAPQPQIVGIYNLVLQYFPLILKLWDCFHQVALLIPSKISFWVRHRAPQVRSPRKNVAHLYRRTRQKGGAKPVSCRYHPENVS